MGLKKFSATLKYESTGCVQYDDTYNSRGHETGDSALIATIRKLAWIAGVAGIGSRAVEAFNTGLSEGQKHIAEHNAEQDTSGLPLSHRLTASGAYEIGHFGPAGFVKNQEVATLAEAKQIIEAHNAKLGV